MTDEITTIELPEDLVRAVHSKSPSEGFTHTFYRYPARFSPEFARAAMLAFTKPGDVVIDPFMGSGTILVEAALAGRHAIGSDISSLAFFLSQVKTTLLEQEDFVTISRWLRDIQPRLNLRRAAVRDHWWKEAGYQKYVPWPIRKTIEFIIFELENLPEIEQRKLVRCALLRTGQWALDCTRNFPSASEFRDKFAQTLHNYFRALDEVRDAIDALPHSKRTITVCLNMAAAELDPMLWKAEIPQKPTLVITSPPYPGVHVLYHRWQIRGRRETPAPFWIIGTPDGSGGSYYTMGSRSPTGVDNYFKSIRESFSRIYDLLAEDAIVVQLVAFSDIGEQLPRYLQAMRNAGYQEARLIIASEKPDSRIWRQVPLRRWYAYLQGETSSSREFLFIHKRLS